MRRAFVFMLMSASACTGSEGPADAGSDDSGGRRFIAQPSDFLGFRDWEAVAVGASPDGHPSDAGRVVYLKSRTAAGTTAYPVGSILVKTIEQGPPQQWTIHAMVKRGTPFNTGGAAGWEWFELALDDDERPVIVWRGSAPPEGESYFDLRDGGVPLDRNSCHATGGQDAILTPALWPGLQSP